KTENSAKIYYTAKEGETLEMIAAWFACDIIKLRNMNNIFGNTVNAGQQLMIMEPKDKAAPYENFDTVSAETKAVIFKERKAEQEALALKAATSGSSTATEEGSTIAGGYKITTQKIPYKVKNGDNLSVIAARYKCTVNNLREWNNLRSSKLFIGQ